MFHFKALFLAMALLEQDSVLLIWLNENLPFHGTFSRHGITRASSVLLIWLNENLPFWWGWLQALFLMVGGVAPDGMRNGGTAACCNHEMRAGQKFSAQWPLGSAAGLSKNTQGVTCRVACAMQGQKR